MQSGGDTNIKGGVISANGVVASVGGDLNIHSLQDKAVYDSKQNSAGFSASICIPPFCYGASSASGSVSKASVNGDYLSVVEQSGIKAGDGGFQLVVHGNTDLVGGVISSSQAAIDQGKNTLATGSLTYAALQNKDVYEADSFAMSGTVSGKFGDQTTAKSAADQKAAAGKAAPSASGGIGHDSGSQSSTTASGISAGTLTITDASRQAATGTTAEQALAGIVTGVTTETAASQAGALTQAWNGAALMKEVQAQTQITQAFSAQAPKAIATIADRKEQDLLREAEGQVDNSPEQKALLVEAARWEEGGVYRTALHAAAGALSGGLDGALGAGTISSAAVQMEKLQGYAQLALQDQGVSPEVARVMAQGLAELTSAGVGQVVGGAGGAATSLAVDTDNRQLHPKEISWIVSNAADFAKTLSAKLERPVSLMEAMSWLTTAGQADVDKTSQYAATLGVGLATSQESQAFMAAKQFIAGNAKESFIDSNYISQKLFVAKGADFYSPTVYSQYKSDPAYRDFLWQTVGENLKPTNPTAAELAVYNSREQIIFAQSVPRLIGVAVVAAAGLGANAWMNRTPIVTVRPSILGKPDTMLPDSELLSNKPSGIADIPFKASGGGAGVVTTISAEMETKILYGVRSMNSLGEPSNKLIGAHSGEISNDNVNYAVETLSTNNDGTRNVKLVAQLPDGQISRIKSSTLFPDSWSDAETLSSIKVVGGTAPVAIRSSDGAALYQSTVNGVKIEVIKVGDDVTAGYPTGVKGFQTISQFIGIKK